MRHDKLARELRLLLLLTDNRNYTVSDLCQQVGIERRNLYYYLDFFRLAGFQVVKNRTFYHIDRQSPFFRELLDNINFTRDEAILLRKLLSGAEKDHPLVQHLQQKLDRFYDLRIFTDVKLKAQLVENISTIQRAIEQKQLVKLVNYSSPSSGTVGDRIIEPFQFLGDTINIRGYELSSHKNKTYKLTRLERVELIDLRWSHEKKHREVFTDCFLFSGEHTYHIHLRLGQLSCNLLKEEYPQAAGNLTPYDESHWDLHLDVCDYRGIGRFVLGLWEDIEILGSDVFKAYINEKILQRAHSLEDKAESETTE